MKLAACCWLLVSMALREPLGSPAPPGGCGPSGLASAQAVQELAADDAQRLPRIPALSVPQALAAFQIDPAFVVQLVAAEPEVMDPVALCFDADGRAYVAEMRGYSERADEFLGRVRRLEDRDGDGHFEHATVFLKGLSWPTALVAANGGIYVAASASLMYAADRDGDGAAELVRTVWTGFDRRNVQGLVNSLCWGPDQRIWGSSSLNGGALLDRDGRPVITLRGRDFSFDPRDLSIRAEVGGGQHGACFDDAGRRFVCSNSDHLQMIVHEDPRGVRRPGAGAPRPRVSIALDGPQAPVYRISPVEPWRILRTRLRVAGEVPGPIEGGGTPAGYFTGSSGLCIYRGDAWPPEHRGLALVGDVGSNILHRKRLQPAGVEMRGERIDVQREFLASSDVWFRPVHGVNAPDGCLWVLDMAREVIEHPASLPPRIKTQLDLNSGHDRGRLWRIAPRGHVPRPAPRLSEASTAQLVALLEHDNAWHRETADRLLFERQDPEALGALRQLLASCGSALGRLHALSALAGQGSGPAGALRPAELLRALEDPADFVRERAVKLCERVVIGPALRRGLSRRVDDPAPRVRLQLAFSLGVVDPGGAQADLARLLAGGADPWLRHAALSSLQGPVGGLLEDLLQRRDAALCRVGVALQDAVEELSPRAREELLAQCRGRAESPQRPALERAAAVRLAAALDPGLDPRSWWGEEAPIEVQCAVVEVLGRRGGPEALSSLLERWRQASPGLRQPLLDAMAARSPWAARLLEAMHGGEIPPSQVGRPFLARLAAHPDPRVAAAARALLDPGAVPPAAQDRIQAVLALRGEPEAGREVFRRRCAACHRLDGVGHETGPQLRAVAARGREHFLRHVLEPNAEVQPAYLEYAVFTRDGRILTGMIESETSDQLILRRAEGRTEAVPRAQIETLRSSGRSLMPDGLHEDLSAQDLADLCAYVGGQTP